MNWPKDSERKVERLKQRCNRNSRQASGRNCRLGIIQGVKRKKKSGPWRAETSHPASIWLPQTSLCHSESITDWLICMASLERCIRWDVENRSHSYGKVGENCGLIMAGEEYIATWDGRKSWPLWRHCLVRFWVHITLSPFFDLHHFEPPAT